MVGIADLGAATTPVRLGKGSRPNEPEHCPERYRLGSTVLRFWL
jgi:hypothetical protein